MSEEFKEKKFYPWDNKIEIADSEQIIGARKCILQEVSLEDTIKFLKKYHYQGSCDGQTVRLGLFYNNNLIELMTFGKSRYRARVQYELLRLCTKSGYKVIGGAEKLFKYFIDNYTPNSIISYCDNAKFTGEVYLKLGMKKIDSSNSRIHFWRERDKKHFTFAQVLRYGVNNLLKTNYEKFKSNTDLMRQEGFEVIEDEGQSAYLYLDKNQYFGYIYLTTDTTNGKQYVGQHISNTFDPNYYGSGNLIHRIVKNRRSSLKVEILEWCKEDINEREIYYINKYNTLHPNGYNLTLRTQGQYQTDNQSISERRKAWNKTPEGIEFNRKNRQKLIDFYKTEEGKKAKARQVEKILLLTRRRNYT